MSAPLRTPVDLDAAARALERLLEHTSSPQRQFLAIISFFDRAAALPASWLYTYKLAILPRLAALAAHPYIENVHPGTWASCLRLFSAGGEDRVGGADRASVVATAAARTAKAFGQTGALRFLHDIFIEVGLAPAPLDETAWAAVFGAANSVRERFRAYVGAMAGTPASSPLEGALASWDAFCREEQAISTVLLESGGADGERPGLVVGLHVTAERAAESATVLGATLDATGTSTARQAETSHRGAMACVARLLRARVPACAVRMEFRARGVAIGGASFGLAAAIGAVCALSQETNASRRWSVHPTAGAIGGIDAEGRVEDSAWEIVRDKLTCCFFSPVEAVAIPAAHTEAAIGHLRSLQEEFPLRSLDLLGVSMLDECIGQPSIASVRERPRFERAREFIQRHATAAVAALVVLLAAVGAWGYYLAYYDYPNLEHALGVKIGTNSIVFNPKDSLRWCFRDGNCVQEPFVPFGDLEIGDGFTRNFWIWNMTPRDLRVMVSLEGPDAPEWYINWNGGVKVVPSDTSLRMSVMFAPRRAAGRMRADLVLRDPESRRELYRLRFEGAAGAPLPAGAALRLDGIGDAVMFGDGGVEFMSPEATYECWVRTRGASGNLLYCGSNRPDKAAIANISIGMTRDSVIIQLGAVERWLRLPPVARFNDSWRHVALAWSTQSSEWRLYIDGMPIAGGSGFHRFTNPASSLVTVGAFHDGTITKNFLKADIDEMRLWDVMRSQSDIRRTMHRRLPADEPHLLGTWNMDNINEVIAFTSSTKSGDAALEHRPSKVRSDAPIDAAGPDAVVRHLPSGRQVLDVLSGRFLVCRRPIVPRFSEATLAFGVSIPPDTSFVFAIQTLDRAISLAVTEQPLLTYGIRALRLSVSPGWHQAAVRIRSGRRFDFFIDGAPVVSEPYVDTRGRFDWLHRYEGIEFGFYDDRYNTFGFKGYTLGCPSISFDRSYAQIRMWNRPLSDEEIKRVAEGGHPPDNGLVAWWPLDTLPDGNCNEVDRVNGHLLHVDRVLEWAQPGAMNARP